VTDEPKCQAAVELGRRNRGKKKNYTDAERAARSERMRKMNQEKGKKKECA
jgi:hypothetical protein